MMMDQRIFDAMLTRKGDQNERKNLPIYAGKNAEKNEYIEKKHTYIIYKIWIS